METVINSSDSEHTENDAARYYQSNPASVLGKFRTGNVDTNDAPLHLLFRARNTVARGAQSPRLSLHGLPQCQRPIITGDGTLHRPVVDRVGSIAYGFGD